MNEREWLRSLERDGEAPPVDVAAKVLRTIRVRQAAGDEPGLAWPALFAALAGGAAMVVIVQTLAALADPFGGFLDAFKLVLQ